MLGIKALTYFSISGINVGLKPHRSNKLAVKKQNTTDNTITTKTVNTVILLYNEPKFVHFLAPAAYEANVEKAAHKPNMTAIPKASIIAKEKPIAASDA